MGRTVRHSISLHAAAPIARLVIWWWLVALSCAVPATASSWVDDVRGAIGNQAPMQPRDELAAVHAMIAGLRVRQPGLVLAAAVTAEGHWTFINQAGQRFTTASERELGRVYRNLAPDIRGRPAPVVIYLTGASVFAHSEHLDELPVDARLRLATGGTSYPLRRFGRGEQRTWFVEVRANIYVRTTDEANFVETTWQLARPLKARAMRVIALDPGAPDTFRPSVVHQHGKQVSDPINPAKFVAALPTLRRQTAVLTGRFKGKDILIYRTPSGQERALDLPPLRRRAAEVDANLVFVNASAPRQPGARNWLWLRVEVDGLVDALKRQTLGDFLNALAGGAGQLFVESRPSSGDRVTLSVIPMRAGVLEKQQGTISSVLAELVSEVVGSVVPHAVNADLVSRRRQIELDRRLLPGVPAWLQYGFGLAVVIGLLGLPVALDWWRRIWVPEERVEYAAEAGFAAARAVRFVLFVLVFLPLVGVPAVLFGIVRLMGWIAGVRGAKPDGADAKTASR